MDGLSSLRPAFCLIIKKTSFLFLQKHPKKTCSYSQFLIG
uniref:Uncharacterized protein n=1 Tax=Anguilla anguilla TaxID=7936 RepID=A0A0E9UP43_ANGAN